MKASLRKKTGFNEKYSYPEKTRSDAPVQVIIDVTRFDTGPNGNAVLTAFWMLKDIRKSANGDYRKSVFTVRTASDSYADRVAALNRLLAEFSREIAVAAVQD